MTTPTAYEQGVLDRLERIALAVETHNDLMRLAGTAGIRAGALAYDLGTRLLSLVSEAVTYTSKRMPVLMELEAITLEDRKRNVRRRTP